MSPPSKLTLEEYRVQYCISYQAFHYMTIRGRQEIPSDDEIQKEYNTFIVRQYQSYLHPPTTFGNPALILDPEFFDANSYFMFEMIIKLISILLFINNNNVKSFT